MPATSFMPHGHCYLWNPELVWTQVLANGLIGVSYVAIASTLAYLVHRVRDLPFRLMYVAFGVFIVTCGFTHFMDVWVIWRPLYWADGGLRVVTAVASVGTALLLPPLIPKAIALARGAKAAHDRGLELESVVKDLGTLYERTRALDATKTQFFANVSHELRTPLTLLLAPTERVLAEATLTPEQKSDLQLVLRNARRMLRQVNDLLEAATLESGAARLERANLDLAELVRLTAVQFETLAADRHLALVIRAPLSLAAQLDAVKVERVLLNLLANAFKFTPEGGRIRCELKMGDDPSLAVVEIADSGPGIPAEHREAVFQRFRQLPGSSEGAFGGTGLGLAIVKEFVELHGGTAAISQAPEGGALVRIVLPLRAPVDAAVAEKATLRLGEASWNAHQTVEELRPGTAPAAPLSGEGRSVVLVVEDNPELNHFLTETLAREHRVAPAHDGAEGLRLAQIHRPDLVLTDLMMPRMDGEALIAELRKSEELREVPVVVLSARADDEQRLRILKTGAQDYVMKPFSAEEVQSRVRNLVSLKRARDKLRLQLESREDDVAQLAEVAAERQRQLFTALESLRAARDQALEASRVKTDFLNLASHELRTPLTGLKLQLGQLRLEAGSFTENQLKLVGKLERSAQRLDVLVRTLLDYTRIQSGRLSVNTELTDVSQLVRETVEEVSSQAEEKRLSVRMELPEVAPMLETDPRLFRLIVVNLLTNAVKFTEEGEVGVAVRAAAAGVELRITDTGPGIPEQEQGRIFEPFEQLERVQRKHVPGVGLGLAIVREVARTLGGEVSLSSAPGRGSTFVVTVPPFPAKGDSARAAS